MKIDVMRKSLSKEAEANKNSKKVSVWFVTKEHVGVDLTITESKELRDKLNALLEKEEESQ